MTWENLTSLDHPALNAEDIVQIICVVSHCFHLTEDIPLTFPFSTQEILTQCEILFL